VQVVEDKIHTHSIKIYERTFVSLKNRQNLLFNRTGKQPKYADLLARAWDFQLAKEAEGQASPVSKPAEEVQTPASSPAAIGTSDTAEWHERLEMILQSKHQQAIEAIQANLRMFSITIQLMNGHLEALEEIEDEEGRRLISAIIKLRRGGDKHSIQREALYAMLQEFLDESPQLKHEEHSQVQKKRKAR
jgi:hypothetical protein